MKINLKQVAERSGYSIATVSRVLSGKAKGRSQSVEDILYAARDLGYASKISHYSNANIPLNVALVTMHEPGEFYSYLYESFDKISSQKRIQLSIHSIKYNNSFLDKLRFLSHSNNGLILMLPNFTNDKYLSIKKKINPFPIVSISPSSQPAFHTVTFDSYDGGKLAAQNLIKSGYTVFGHIAGPISKPEANLRRAGFIDEIKKSDFKIEFEYKGEHTFESGRLAFESIDLNKYSNLGIFSSNDEMAMGFLSSAIEKDKFLLKTWGIIGYDNMPSSKIFHPKLSSIGIDLDKLAALSLDKLTSLIKDPTLNLAITTTLIPVNAIMRETHRQKRYG